MKTFLEKLARFSVKHGIWAFLLFSIVSCLYFTVMFLYLNSSLVWIVLIDVLAIIWSGVTVFGANGMLMNKAISLLNDFCYPQGLLEECEEQSKYIKKGVRYQNIQMNTAAAFMEMGEYDKAESILLSFNPESASFSILTRFVYYHNLSSLYYEKGDYEKSDAFFNRQMECYDAIKNERLKKNFYNMVQSAYAFKLLRENNFEQALKISEETETPNLRSRVNIAFLQAKAYIGLDEGLKAKEKLDFVIENGGTLFLLEEAKELLKQIKI